MSNIMSTDDEDQFLQDIATVAKPFLRAVQDMAQQKGVPVWDLLQITTQAYLAVGRFILEDAPGVNDRFESRKKGTD